MMKQILAAAAIGAAGGAAQAQDVVTLHTSAGDITIQLDAEKAPVSVENFLGYARDGYYDGTVFHRVIEGFMIQGGGFTETMQQKPTRAPIVNEGGNGLKNTRGSIAMARTNAPDSATSQFFINHGDNAFLDRGVRDPHGYAVFGAVTDGMDVVDQIAGVRTGRKGMHSDVPIRAVVIERVSVHGGSDDAAGASGPDSAADTDGE